VDKQASPGAAAALTGERLPRLRFWSQALREASRARDWLALGRLDGELAQALRDWAARGGVWTPAERQALEQLKLAHAQARAICEAELRNLGDTLDLMRQGRDRWQAYSESASWSAAAGEEELSGEQA
jgi:hypothetical protein